MTAGVRRLDASSLRAFLPPYVLLPAARLSSQTC